MRRSDRRQVYDELLGVIRSVRRRWRLRILVRGLAATGAAALGALLVAGIVADGMEPDDGAVLWLRIGVAAVVAVAAFITLFRPLVRRVSDETIALYLEEHEPSLEAAVLSALDADSAGPDPSEGTPAISDAMLRRTLETAIQRCHQIDDGRWIERGALARGATALIAVLVLATIAGFLGPLSARRGAASLFRSPRPVEATGPRAVLVTPGNATVSRGADASISARLQGFEADLVELGVRSVGDSAFDRLPMAGGPDGRFGYLLFDLDADTEYFVEAGGVRSDVFRLTVAELPYVDRLDLELVFPAYTGLPPRTVEDGGDLAALRGTTVRVTATPTLPVDGGGIVVDGADPIALAVDTASGALKGEFRVRADGFYRLVLDGPSGETVEGSPRYVIDALSDGEPIVAFEEPGRDERATAIDELYVEARAEDDYGVGAMTLHFAVNGGEEQTVELYGGRGELREVTAGHTFYLEEYGLEPGDLVSYYATAVDNDAVDGRKTATSDIYFIQVRPFSRDYTAAQNRQMPGQQARGQQGPDGDLTELQRQIIAGTFNLVRDRDEYTAAERRENLNTLALSQERLRDQTRTLAERMVARRVTADTAFLRIAEILPRAADAMDEAVLRLREEKAEEALPPEQRALQQLQRAEAIFREVQVTLGQQAGGGQQSGGAPNAEDLADLFELEMDKLEDQYETVNRGGARQDSASAAVDETAERLEELARRQQREIERQRREAAQGRGTAGGAAQRELADQVEEEARRLERLSREQNRPELQDAARRLRDAAESMRRSAAGSRDGERAMEGLREARRMLQRSQGEELRRRMQEAEGETERMAREQERIRQESESLLEMEPGEERGERQRRLQDRKESQRQDVEALERDLRDLAGEANAEEQAEAARRLDDAADRISELQLEEKIEFSRQLAAGGAPDEYVRELEGQIQEDLEELSDRLAGLDDTLEERDDGEEGERALEEAGDLARDLESMRQRTGEARERASGNPGGGGRFDPGAIRQGRSEAQERLEDARELRNRLDGQGVDTDEIDALIQGLRELTGAEAYRDPEELARLQAGLADRAKRLELVLRMRLTGEERLRLFLSGDPSVDPEYRELVEEYYRSLSRENEGR